jgi:putative nucleotidyltransferase with HDIG domain
VTLIRQLGVKYVFFYPKLSDTKPLLADISRLEEIPDSSLEQEQLWEEKKAHIEQLNSYRRRISHCEEEYSRSLSQMRSIMAKLRFRPEDVVADTQELIDDIVDNFLAEESVSLHLMTANDGLEDTYYHSLNVAVLSMMLGQAKGFSEERLKQLSFAALAHDIGKIRIPQAILRKKSALTVPEQQYLERHTKYGLDMVMKMSDFPEAAKVVITQHHELLDGSGYPQGLKGDEIDELAQIVCLVSDFDSLCHSHDPKQNKIPHVALSHLYKNCKHLYDTENLAILVRLIGVYPPGTVVQLSNEMVGMVISVNAEKILSPNILIYDASIPRAQAPIIELSKSDIKILSAVSPSKLPLEVYEYLNPRARVSYFFDSEG